MARVNVYLPDDLATAAKEAGLNVSAVTQEAIRHHLDASATDRWLASLKFPKAGRVSRDRALAALDAAREEPPTRHG